MIRLIFAICLLLSVLSSANAHNGALTVSVLDFGDTDFGKQAAEKLRANFRALELSVADVDLTRSAAKGSGYAGSLNLTLSEARDLGAALATDFYVLGDAQVLRRSSFASPVYFEAYCSVFVVSSRTGRLVMWNRPSFNNANATQAQSLLSHELDSDVSPRLRLA